MFVLKIALPNRLNVFAFHLDVQRVFTAAFKDEIVSRGFDGQRIVTMSIFQKKSLQ